MKTKLIFSFLFAATMIMMTSSCTKDEGFVEKATIKGTVTYEGGNAHGALVKIKFGATEESTGSDYTTVSDANGKYSFNSLQKGNYYVDASYTNPDGITFNTAGYLVEVGGAKNEVTVDIALK